MMCSFLVEASTSQGRVNLGSEGELPSEECFTIQSIVRDLEFA